MEKEDIIEEIVGQKETQEDKFLTFQIGKEEFAIGISHVIEIIGIQKITNLPNMPSHVKGVINLRGKVIPVIDIRLRFGMEERAYDDRTCIVVVNIDEVSVGFIVDQVKEVMDILTSNIDPPPSINKGKENRCVQGLGKVGESVKIILDVNKLLFEDELTKYMEA